MKKIIFACLAAFISTTSVFAAPTALVTEKVLKVFHDAFPEVKQPPGIILIIIMRYILRMPIIHHAGLITTRTELY